MKSLNKKMPLRNESCKQFPEINSQPIHKSLGLNRAASIVTATVTFLFPQSNSFILLFKKGHYDSQDLCTANEG